MISETRRFGPRTVILFLAFVLSAVSISSFARPWKPTPSAMAMDYSQINDNRGGKELILIWWLNSPSLATLPPSGREVLDKYIVIGAVHGHISPEVVMTFDEIPPLEAKSGSTNLTSLSGDAIPPSVAGMLTTLETSLGQAMGQAGKGMRWFVFDAGSLHACDKGSLSVALADETYTWETPIPGCTAK
jgi:hypothetical protein